MNDMTCLSMKELIETQENICKEICDRAQAAGEILTMAKALAAIRDRPATKEPEPVCETLKYRNPHDHRQTWHGIGRHPTWYKTCIASGIPRENLLVANQH